MKVRPTALVTLVGVGVGVGVSGLALAQPRPLQKAPPAVQTATIRPIALPIQTKPVAIPTQLEPVIAQKPVFDPARLQGKLTYVGKNIPQLQILPNKSILLEPVNEAPPTFAPVDPALQTRLTKYLPHFSARYFGKARPPLRVIEKVVDHKAHQTPIRDQGPRGTCVAFASMAGLEWYFKKASGTAYDLSENHAYNVFMSKVGSSCMADPGIRTVDAADYLRTERVCDEALSPYVSSTTSSCATIPAPCTVAKRHGITIASKFFSPEFGGTGDQVATNTSYLESLVNLGFPIVMGVYVAGSDWSDGSAESGVVDVQRSSGGQPAAAYGGHAMLLVGYNSTMNYFIFKNSWGSAAGHDGYYHLSYEYLQTYAKYGYVILGATNPA